MKKLRISEKIILGVIVLILFVLGIINIVVLKNEKFFEFSFSTCVSIIVALFVSYWLVNSNQDERNQKEIYLRLLEKTISLVNDSIMFRICETSDVSLILMKKRELNNTLTLLKKYAKKFDVSDEIKFIEERVQEYTDLIGNHQDDLLHLAKCERDLRRPLELIESKIYEVMLKIFD